MKVMLISTNGLGLVTLTNVNVLRMAKKAMVASQAGTLYVSKTGPHWKSTKKAVLHSSYGGH